MLCDFGLRHVSRDGVAGSRIWSPCLAVPEQGASGPREGCIGTRWLLSMCQPKLGCGCYEMQVYKVCCVRQHFYVTSLYRSPDLDNPIFDCLLKLMSDVQAEDVHASLLFVGDLNGNHQEWLGSTTTNRHGGAAFDFATVSGYDQLVVGPTHAGSGTLDLLMTDVLDLIRIAVLATIRNSDHSSLSAVILMAQAVPNLYVSRNVFLKHRINWNTVCGAIQDLPWCNI